MEPMAQPTNNVKEEIAELRRGGDPRFSAETKKLFTTLLTGSEYGNAVDALVAGDFDDVDSDD